jgi:hypothetical protein
LIRKTFALSVIFVMQACATMPSSGTVPAEQRSIEIPVNLTPAKALELVQSSALRGGWTIAESNGSMVSTDAYILSTARAFKVKLRANAVTSGSGSLIYLTGIYGNIVLDKSNNGAPKDPIVGGPFGRMNHVGPLLWAELERFANAVRLATK